MSRWFFFWTISYIGIFYTVLVLIYRKNLVGKINIYNQQLNNWQKIARKLIDRVERLGFYVGFWLGHFCFCNNHLESNHSKSWLNLDMSVILFLVSYMLVHMRFKIVLLFIDVTKVNCKLFAEWIWLSPSNQFRQRDFSDIDPHK